MSRKNNNNELKIYYNAKVKYSTYIANTNIVFPLGTIYRIYNKRTGKSLINVSEDPKNDIKDIINKLDHGIFYIKEIQDIWKKDYYQFAAEDLQHYYNNNQIPILLNIWKIYFGGKDFELLYNIDNTENINLLDIQEDNKKLSEENQYYATYLNKLLNENKKLQEQVNILNTNLLQLQSYDYKVYNNLSELNNAILKHITDSPIQVLQMLTSLLTINTAEINKQSNVLIINNKLLKNHNIQQNQDNIQQINNKKSENKSIESFQENLNEEINNNNDNKKDINNIENNNDIDKISNHVDKLLSEIKDNDNIENVIDMDKNDNIDEQNDTKEELTSEELIQAKLKVAPKKITKRRTSKKIKTQTDDGFIFFNGQQPLNEWCDYAFNWLKKEHINFANELKREIIKSTTKNKVSKALQILIDYVSGKSYDELSTKFNLSRDLLIRYIDSLQNTAPAIYLSFGCGRKNSAGKDKRVVNVLNNKNIIDIPVTF